MRNSRLRRLEVVGKGIEMMELDDAVQAIAMTLGKRPEEVLAKADRCIGQEMARAQASADEIHPKANKGLVARAAGGF